MKINARQGGFTLVEIMIVVAIIALLASIAVPNFMRARLRTQAGLVKDELRMIDAAVDQYAIEKNLSNGNTTITWAIVKQYIKVGSPLYNSDGKDSLKNDFTWPQIVGTLPKVPATTYSALSDVADDSYWSPFGHE